MYNQKLFVCFLFMLFSGSMLVAQSQKLKNLEAQRTQKLREIRQINSLLLSGKKEEQSIVTLVENYNYKINVRKNLIKITNDQANQLTREINTNQKEITSLRTQLKELKEDYAAMIVKSYKSKSQQSKVMFLLSSDNFKQAYKRLQYINQYREYQKKQAEEIKVKTQDLQALNITLSKQKEEKKKLVEENKKAKETLELETKEQERLMASIRKDLSKHTAQIRKKRQEADRIDKEIDRLIKEAIAASNTKAGSKSSSGTFVLTPSAKKLAANFAANKGKLGWPVERGVIKLKFGKQRSLIDNTVTENSFGIRIATEKNAKVKAVFKGEVSKIMVIKNANPAILVRHGDYLTIYRNLSKVYVKAGDEIETGQEIGEVFTNKFTGESLLYFRMTKNSQNLNPEYWLSKN
ncbi:murein hydrolase activator EnvC family protein [Winogradskyella immobilis]|uniref:Peptidoglycan DD-metalloendopeptidase family protein n=1 Tax=Winogradskyella immobilis TaxID=2816852 RepID=A0ABS8EQT4_9FLAO|nr:peptidoglycan DD-metalloendopeptidase family protein [Winogradskyella immobilis]MCC1485599.1 peptidoglycan DD-metalloendopeptidase family protein [Winogradskyella immobilis]MCG0017691.1 peptidoglycan DD-metalloendopeptidase family protein [Winogradskyella immobilis]